MNRSKLRVRRDLLVAICDALDNGKTLSWGSGERTSKSRVLRELGIELVTKTGARKRGLRIKRGATPVANGYFTAPLQVYADLYIVGVQTAEVPQSGDLFPEASDE